MILEDKRVGGASGAEIEDTGQNEVMVTNGRIRDCILDGDKTHDIHEIVAESGFYGMQTFNQALIKLFQTGQVELEDAKNATSTEATKPATKTTASAAPAVPAISAAPSVTSTKPKVDPLDRQRQAAVLGLGGDRVGALGGVAVGSGEADVVVLPG